MGRKASGLVFLYNNWAILHIPRTGGTNFKHNIYHMFQARHPALHEQFPAVHAPVGVLPDPEKRYLVIVRDPYARAVSLCAYMLQYRSGRRTTNKGRALPIEEFEAWVMAGAMGIDKWYTAPQRDFIEAFSRQIQYTAHTETLPDDISHWVKQNFPSYRLPDLEASDHRNIADHMETALYYRDAEVFQAVTRRYSGDLPFRHPSVVLPQSLASIA